MEAYPSLGFLAYPLLSPSEVFTNLNFDGASKANSSLAGYGGIIRDWGHKVLWIYATECGISSNNEVEFLTLEMCIKLVVSTGYSKLHIDGDSQLVIKTTQKLIQGAFV